MQNAAFVFSFTLFGNITVVIVFIDQWCDYNSVTSVVRTHLGVYSMDLVSAFRRGDKKAAKHLLPHTDNIANITTWFSSTRHYNFNVSLLHLAAYRGWLDVIDNLITRYGCNPHCTDSRGHSSLHYAASKGHLEVVRHLISA